jgi:hypothetical protein
MTTELLPEFTRASVSWLRQALGERKNGISQEEGRQFALLCGSIARQVSDLLLLIQDRLRGGVESRALLQELRNGIAVADEALREFGELRGRVSGTESAATLSLIERTLRDVEAVRTELLSIARWADSPPPPIDLDKLAAADAGPFVRLEEPRGRRGSQDHCDDRRALSRGTPRNDGGSLSGR